MSKPETYVLIHGAWHAAWCWNKMIPLLKDQGHEVMAPDLPGHGALKCPPCDIHLKTYVQAVTSLLAAMPEPVILVGHSMAGMVISAVAECLPEKIKQLVYVCAYLPESGESLMQLAARASSHRLSPYLEIQPGAGVITLAREAAAIDLMYGMSDEGDKRTALAHCEAQPLAPFTDEVSLSDRFHAIPKRAIIGLHDRVIAASDQRAMAARATADVVMIASDHAPYYSNPEALFLALCFNDNGSQ